MRHIFLDETGDWGFTTGSSYFIIATISPESAATLGRVIKKFNARLISEGWNKEIEIKATNLFNCPRNPQIPGSFKYKNRPELVLREILTGISRLEIEIDYLVINLREASTALRSLSHDVLYNKFALEVLTERLMLYPAATLWVDRRSKHEKQQMHFNGFIDTEIHLKRAGEKKEKMSLAIRHIAPDSIYEVPVESRGHIEFAVRGLQAVDFVCWAIKRNYENLDTSWETLLQGTAEKDRYSVTAGSTRVRLRETQLMHSARRSRIYAPAVLLFN